MKYATAAILILTLTVSSCPKGSDGAAPVSNAPSANDPAAISTGQQGDSTGASTPSSPSASPEFTATVPPAGQASSPGTAAPGQAAPSPAAPGAGTSSPSGETPPAASAPTAIQRQIGELVYAEGSVMVHRAGAGQERLDIGDVVRQFDVLITGPKSKAEVDIAGGKPGGASVKLAENTAFYFDTRELGPDERKTVIQLLGGAIAVKVDKLAGGSFSVASDSAVMGVRGTVFVIDTIPDGALLVTCSEGSVAVEGDGTTVISKPGQAVAQPVDGRLSATAVASAGLSSYRGSWKAEAIAGFSANALRYTASYAAAIDADKAAFSAAYAKLKGQAAALSAWRSARAAGKVPRFTDWTAEKKAVAAVLFDCLKILFKLERPYYRLVELKAWHEAGTGVGTLADGRDSAAFFRAFESSNADLVAGMASVREALDLFSWASAGSPLGDFFGAKAESLGSGALFLGD